MPTIVREYYSAGYNIAQEYIASLESQGVAIREIIQSIKEDQGYFPIITADGYKYETLFLMGLSDGLDAPVKVLYESDIQDEIEVYSYENFSYWLFVDPSGECINTFQCSTICNTEDFYIFMYDQTKLDGFNILTNHQYIIQEKAEYINTILVGMRTGEDYQSRYADWMFDPLQIWIDKGYSAQDTEVQDSYLEFWCSLNYGINEEVWTNYKNYIWGQYTGDTSNMCRIEMIVVPLEA